MTNRIRFFHQIDSDIENLERNYIAALNMCMSLRLENASILKLIHDKRYETINDLFMPKNIEEFYERRKDSEELFKDLRNYNFDNGWAKLIDLL